MQSLKKTCVIRARCAISAGNLVREQVSSEHFSDDLRDTILEDAATCIYLGQHLVDNRKKVRARKIAVHICDSVILSAFVDVVEMRVDALRAGDHCLSSVKKLTLTRVDDWTKIPFMFPNVVHFSVESSGFCLDDDWMQGRMFPKLQHLWIHVDYMTSSNTLPQNAVRRDLVELKVYTNIRCCAVDWDGFVNPATLRSLIVNIPFSAGKDWWCQVQTVFTLRIPQNENSTARCLLRPPENRLGIRTLDMWGLNDELVEQERDTLRKIYFTANCSFAMPSLGNIHRVVVRFMSSGDNAWNLDTMKSTFQSNPQLISFCTCVSFRYQCFTARSLRLCRTYI